MYKWQHQLKKGMLYVMIANLINLGFNLITNFVLPKELSVGKLCNDQDIFSYILVMLVYSFWICRWNDLKYGGKIL